MYDARCYYRLQVTGRQASGKTIPYYPPVCIIVTTVFRNNIMLKKEKKNDNKTANVVSKIVRCLAEVSGKN